jgi:hypothetical protein
VAADKNIQLSHLEKASWVDEQGCGLDTKPSINVISHPWAVLQNDNVYVKDTGIDSRTGEGIWQYSIKDNTWSPHPRPDLFGFKGYTLTVFDAQLTCFGGLVRREDKEEYTDNKSVFAWNGRTREWKDDIEQIPENVKLPSSDKLSASSDNTHLYLAWQEDRKVRILRYSRRSKWERMEDGPDCESSGSRIEISVLKKTIFLTEHNDMVRTVIRKASVSSLSSSSVPAGHNIWTEITWAGIGLRDICGPYSFLSNLTVMGGNIVLLAPLPRSSSTAMLYNLETTESSDHSYWTMIGHLQIPSWKPDSHLSIFSLHNKTLLIIGYTGDSLRTSAKVCVHKR